MKCVSFDDRNTRLLVWFLSSTKDYAGVLLSCHLCQLKSLTENVFKSQPISNLMHGRDVDEGYIDELNVLG